MDYMTQSLGREVPTTQQVLEVIRPELRIMRATYRGVIDAIRREELQADPDLELTDGGDQHAYDVVFSALLDDAVDSVGQWSRDLGLVYDSTKVREFCRRCMCDAMVTIGGEEQLPEGALEY